MAAAAPATPPLASTFELKSAALSLVAVVLHTADLGQLARAFDERFADAPELFDQDPVAIDLSQLRETPEPIDFAALLTLLRSHKMRPVAVQSGTLQQMADGLAAGLCEAQAGPAPRTGGKTTGDAPTTLRAAEAVPPRSALIIDKPLRSGQRVYAKGADLIVLALVSFGAEVIADGNIHVYAPLRGRALAGALGDTSARIFTTCMEPQLLSIAGIYRTTEHELGADVLGKPAHVRLDGDKLLVAPLNP